MQPSSLVFLVIIAIWAAYFIQHWVRRREHLATARSVDRFSESMRVLEHRAPLPVADLSAPQPRSYAVSPARPARPEILVKRAGHATPASKPASESPRESASAPAASTGAATAPHRGLASRRVRGLTLLGSLAATVLFLLLAVVGVVPWLAVLLPVAGVAGAFVWVRQGVEAERAARRAVREGRPTRTAAPVRSQQARPAHQAAQSAARHTARPATSRLAEAEAEIDADDEAPASAEPQPVVARESFYDIEAAERGPVADDAGRSAHHVGVQSPAATATPAVPLVDEDDIPLTWDPVPVPRPTYTMKAVAHRVPGPPVGQGVPPELADAAYEEPVRRVAGA